MPSIITREEGEIGWITLHRPNVHNALNSEMLQEIYDISKNWEKQMRLIIVTGFGEKAFCAGADIREMAAMSPKESSIFTQLGHKTMATLEEGNPITVAMLNGFALGGGLELALSCDFIFAAQGIKVGLPEVGLGLIPGFGGTQRLPKRIGYAAALDWILTAKVGTSDEAQELGMFNGMVPKAELKEYVTHFSKKILELPRHAQIKAKKAIRSNDFALERTLFDECLHAPKTVACIEKFLSKKKESIS